MRKCLLYAMGALMLLIANVQTASAQTWTSSELAEGQFYLYNVGKDGFLTSGANWGTRAIIGEDAILVTISALSDGTYNILTSPTYTDCYLGSDGYVDKSSSYSSVAWTITAVEGLTNTYTLMSNSKYIEARDADEKTTMQSSLPDDAAFAYWQLISRADALKDLESKATDDNQLNATWILSNPAILKGSSSDTWNGEPDLGGYYISSDGNYCAEKWNATFDVYQSFTDVPNGLYTIKVQGFYRVGDGSNDASAAAKARLAGNEVLNAKFYMNGFETDVPSIFDNQATTYSSTKHSSTGYTIDDSGNTYYVPTTMSRAAYCFTDGEYETQFNAIVTDGTMRIGVKNEVTNNFQWCIFDNFRLYYKPLSSAYDSLMNVANTLLASDEYTIVNGVPRADLQTAVAGTGDDTVSLVEQLNTAVENFQEAYKVISQVKESYDELSNYQDLIAQEDQDDLKTILAKAEEYLATDNTTVTIDDYKELLKEFNEVEQSIITLTKDVELQWSETYIGSSGSISTDFDDVFFTQLIDINGADSIKVVTTEKLAARRIYWYRADEISSTNFISRSDSHSTPQTETYAVPEGAAYFTYRFSNEDGVYKASDGYYLFDGFSGVLSDEQNAQVNAVISISLVYNAGKEFGLAAESDSIKPGETKPLTTLFASLGDINETTVFHSKFTIDDPTLSMGMTIVTSNPNIFSLGSEAGVKSVTLSYEDVTTGVDIPFTFTPGNDIFASADTLLFYHGNSQFGMAIVTWDCDLTTDTEKSLTVEYEFANDEAGNADGTLTFRANAHVWRGTYNVYFADENGTPLDGLAELTTVNVKASGEENQVVWSHFSPTQLLPAGAATVVAVNAADNSKVGVFTIPEAKRYAYSDPTYKFGCLSDIHLYDGNQSSTYCLSDYPRALSFFENLGVEFAAVSGDLTQTGYSSAEKLAAQLNNFKTLTPQYALSYPVWATNGNHDTPTGGWTDEYSEVWKEYIGMPVDTVYEVNGDAVVFFRLSAYSFGTSGVPYTYADMKWLDETLQKYSDRRTFLVTHVFVPNYAGDFKHLYPYFVQMYGESLSMWHAMAAKYPDVISFSGHSHWRYYLDQFSSHTENYYQVPDGMAMVHLSGCASPIDGVFTGEDPYADTTDDWARDADYGEGERSEISYLDVYDDHVVFHGLEYKYFDNPTKDIDAANDYQTVPQALYSIPIPGTLPIGNLDATWTATDGGFSTGAIAVDDEFVTTIIDNDNALDGKKVTVTCADADGNTIATLVYTIGNDTTKLTLPENCATITLSTSEDVSVDALNSTEVHAWVAYDNLPTGMFSAEGLDGNAVDMTSYIKNPNFDYNPSNDNSWTSTMTSPDSSNPGAINYSSDYTEIEYYSGYNDSYTKTFDVSQTVTNLPKGYYRLVAQGFERVKDNDNAAAYKAATENIDSYLYAVTSEKEVNTKLRSLYDFTNTGSYNGYAQTMEEAQAAFADGKYDGNVVVFYQPEDGADVKIGVKSDAIGSGMRAWVIFDNFRLYYYGDNTEEITLDAEQAKDWAAEGATGDIKVENLQTGRWVAVTLPFDVPTSEIENVFGEGAKVATLVAESGTTAKFSTKNPVVRAHQPVLVNCSQSEMERGIVLADAAGTYMAPTGEDITMTGTYGYLESLYDADENAWVIINNKMTKVESDDDVEASPFSAYFTIEGSEELTYTIDGVTPKEIIEETKYETVVISAAGWASFSSDNNLDFSSVEGITAYYVDAAENAMANLVEIGNPAGSVGLLVSGEEGSYDIPIVESGTAPENNLLVPTNGGAVTLAPTGEGNWVYAFGYKDADYSNVGFYTLYENRTIEKKHSYLRADKDALGEAGVNFVSFSIDGATVINGINAAKNLEGDIYDMAGRKVNNPSKGIYIVNGEKFLIK